MRNPSILIFVPLVSTACPFFELPDRCLVSADLKFIKLVQAESDKREIPYKREAANKFCYFNDDIETVEQIKKQIDGYYRSVITVLNNPKVEEKLLNWLKTDKLDYKIVNSGGGQRVLLVFSESAQQAKKNKLKLKSIVSGKSTM